MTLTTPNYALRYSESTDNVQLWTQYQNLATDVDTTLITKFGILGRWRRETNKTSTGGTETGIVRIDGIPFLANVYYTIETNSLDCTVVSGETGYVNARLSTAGAATGASAQLGSTPVNANSGTSPRNGVILVAEYAPVANATGSVLLSVGRIGGAGNVTVNGSSTQPIILMIKAWGKNPGVSGVDI